jgi:spermidine synthase
VPPKTASAGRERGFALLLLCFFLSGLAALIYQTAWARLFAFVFGTSELAVASVLAAYMGGLAAGAMAVSRIAPKLRRPLLVYGVLELGIGVAALTVPLGVLATQRLYLLAFGSQNAPADEGGLATALFYLAGSFVILLIPTSLMGATLPLLAQHSIRSDRELGNRIGMLYALNTAGAVAGTLLTGFVLLPAIGLERTVWIAVAVNGLVFGGAALLGRQARGAPAAAPPATAERGDHSGRWILPLIGVSGLVSFSYEVLWTRLLGHLLGGSVYAFSIMLATFLTGIALGSWLASGRAVATRAAAATAFAWIQVGIACCSLTAYLAIDSTPGWIRALGASDELRLVVGAGIAAAILLPGTLCIGATFPMAVRVLARGERDASNASARVYAWNTLGAIVGAVFTGFFLIPAVGFAVTASLAVVANLTLALAAVLSTRPRAGAVLWAAAATLVALIVFRPAPPWSLLRMGPIKLRASRGEIVYHGVGRTASVLLSRVPDGWRITSNGLPEAIVHRPGMPVRRFVPRWLGSLPSWGRPDARSMFVVGLGGGLVVETASPSIDRIEVVEIESEMIRANRAIADLRRSDPLSDPRVHITVNDARSALQLTRERFDAIVSQPSHPWTAAASHLYTREFFELVRSRLSEDGVFVQWMGLGFVDEPLLKTLVATLVEVFPHVQAYLPVSGGLIFTGALRTFEPERSFPRCEVASASPQLYSELGIYGGEDIAAHLVLDDAGARAFAGGAPRNTDDRNLLQSRSPRIARSGKRFDSAARLADFDPLAVPELHWNRIYLLRRMLASGGRERAERLAANANEPERSIALGILARARGKSADSNRLFEQALELDPDSGEARFALLEGLRDHTAPTSQSRFDQVAASATGAQRLVVEGWALEREGRWEELRALDERLAVTHPHDPSFAASTRLRASWRLVDGDTALAAEALELVDGMLLVGGTPTDMLLRARAAASAGYDDGAIASVSRLVGILDRTAKHRSLARHALRVLSELPRNATTDRRRQQLVSKLQRKMRER